MDFLSIFTVHPWLALLLAACFAGLWWWRRSKVAFAVAIGWVVYTGYEYLMLARILCTGECTMRVDLLLIYPLLLLLSLLAFVNSLLAHIEKQRAA